MNSAKTKARQPGRRDKFSCNRCRKQFDTKGSLTRHMQYHTGWFNYFCDKCQKGFPNGGHYKDHMNRHEGVRFHCESCSKSFATKRDHQYHMSVHTGEFRLWCEMCGQGFNVKSQLMKHVVTHNYSSKMYQPGLSVWRNCCSRCDHIQNMCCVWLFFFSIC